MMKEDIEKNFESMNTFHPITEVNTQKNAVLQTEFMSVSLSLSCGLHSVKDVSYDSVVNNVARGNQGGYSR